MGRYRKILVAIDGSESGRNALLQAFRLAVEEQCWITVTSVVPSYAGELDLTGVKDIGALLARPCEEALSEAARLAERERVLIKTICMQGDIHERIVDLADAENADVVVMGRRGLRRVERALMGSVTARVIGHARQDVLVVPSGAVLGWKQILVATDGSRFSDGAVDKAISFAHSYGGDLVAVSVVDAPTELHAEAPESVEGMIRKARGHTEEVKRKAVAAYVGSRCFVSEGEPWEAIVNLAQQESAQMIIMGSHGRTGLRRLLMGSVTEKVIGHASCPVMVVKP